jgi:hypothetical protein
MPSRNEIVVWTAGQAAVQKCRQANRQSERNRDRKSAFLDCRSHRKETGKGRERIGTKKRGKECESESKKVGDRERGKVGGKHCDTGRTRPFDQLLSSASQKMVLWARSRGFAIVNCLIPAHEAACARLSGQSLHFLSLRCLPKELRIDARAQTTAKRERSVLKSAVSLRSAV